MKTKTIKLYEYSELSKEAKKKALNYHNEYDFEEYGLAVHLDNYLSDLLEKYDIKPLNETYAKIYYSLSWSQGDGVMFEGVFDFPTETEKVGRQWKRYEVTVKQSGHYYHSNSKTIEVEPENETVEKEFDEVYQKICKELEKVGYEYIEDMQSEEYFIELCNANEWTFREDGTLELQ